MSAASCKNFSDIYSKNSLQNNISLIASHYITDPLLLNRLTPTPLPGGLGDVKFDLRLYVAITSVNPLKLYVHQEGLV